MKRLRRFLLSPVSFFSVASAFSVTISCLSKPLVTTTSTSTSLGMAQRRGLELRRESATPTEGGMTLYLKAGPDGTSVGDCPFAHFVRLVLEEKKLDHAIQPLPPDSKPQWLVDHYDGKIPALRHRKECYVESNVIVDYIEFFFPEPALRHPDRTAVAKAEQAVEGLFPAMAKYFKHTPDGDKCDNELKENLHGILSKVEAYLSRKDKSRVFLLNDTPTLLDYSLAPKLYHLKCGLKAFKKNAIDIANEFPALQTYMDAMFARESFQKTVYPEQVVTWGWSATRPSQ